MPLTVEPPSAEDEPRGIAAYFEYRDDTVAVTVRGTAKRGERGLTIARLEIEPDNEDVSAGLARRIPFGAILAQIRAALPDKLSETGVTASKASTVRQGGWQPLTDDHMRDMASAYIAETAPGTAPGAMNRLAERFGRPEETIRTWVARARRDGWLGPSIRGRAGAEPGPRLLAAKRKAGTA